jgi:hypothetical protein
MNIIGRLIDGEQFVRIDDMIAFMLETENEYLKMGEVEKAKIVERIKIALQNPNVR